VSELFNWSCILHNHHRRAVTVVSPRSSLQGYLLPKGGGGHHEDRLGHPLGPAPWSSLPERWLGPISVAAQSNRPKAQPAPSSSQA
jgi:hypothetical protein